MKVKLLVFEELDGLYYLMSRTLLGTFYIKSTDCGVVCQITKGEIGAKYSEHIGLFENMTQAINACNKHFEKLVNAIIQRYIYTDKLLNI